MSAKIQNLIVKHLFLGSYSVFMERVLPFGNKRLIPFYVVTTAKASVLRINSPHVAESL